jgi:hypothetical protein
MGVGWTYETECGIVGCSSISRVQKIIGVEQKIIGYNINRQSTRAQPRSCTFSVEYAPAPITIINLHDSSSSDFFWCRRDTMK